MNPTRCFSQTASTDDLEVKLEELPYVNDVTVSLESSTLTHRSYRVTFEDFDHASFYADESSVEVPSLEFSVIPIVVYRLTLVQ